MNTSRLLQGLTAFGCILFGVALIANSQLAYEGGWFWYAWLHHAGKHLYSDMHLVLQPFAVLETDWWMSLAGKGWIVSKVPAFLHLVAFTIGIALLAGRTAWTDLQKAILVAFTFFVSITFEAYRFDDYHVISHACYLLSMFLLFKLGEKQGSRPSLLIAPVLGLLSGLATATRFTDGAILALGTALALAILSGSRRLSLLAAFGVTTVSVIVLLVKLTGDTFSSYIAYAILGAAAPKGGTSHVLLSPLLLVKNSVMLLGTRGWPKTVFFSAAVGVVWAFLLRPFSRERLAPSILKAALGLVLLAVCYNNLRQALKNGALIVILSAVLVLVAYVLASLVLFRLGRFLFQTRQERGGAPQEVVLLLPFGLLLAGSMSSGGFHYGLYAPLAIIALILPLAFPGAFQRKWLTSSVLAVAALMGATGAYGKFHNPVSWHSFHSYPAFSNRIVVHHPSYGPMVIDRSLYGFIEPICSSVKSVPNPELLSIPFSYANYYCGLPLWQGFVQSFFDTSGKDTIDSMIAHLQQSPPQWVLYQRQLDNLRLHEIAFNGGNRLPHRDLDDFIMKKISDGEWQVVRRQAYGAGYDWILLRTR